MLLLLFLGALFWAKAQDPFSRKWFTLKGNDHLSVKCVTVLPKPLGLYPVVIYAHGSGGRLMNDGNDLRQMAEMGLAVVSVEYNQADKAIFDAQWELVLHYLAGQSWVNTNAIVWAGFSLGANLTLDFAGRHPEQSPQLLVQLSGAGLTEGSSISALNSLHCPVLLIHGDQDELFPPGDTRQLAAILQTNGVPVTLHVLPGVPHGLDPERAVIFRGVGEFCRAHFGGPDAWRNYHSIARWQFEAAPLWLFWLPALGMALVLAGWKIRTFRQAANLSAKTGGAPVISPLCPAEKVLRLVAALLAVWAVTETALHLVPPQLAVSDTTLRLARSFLVQPKEQADFEFLARQPSWPGEKLKTLLDHVVLSGYNRTLINWQVDDQLYQRAVLSPIIAGRTGEPLNWRRPLWEEFYPRIRHEVSTQDAAQIVVRHLRERVTIASLPGLAHTVPEIWRNQITDAAGFELIYAAALRSVGVPARLDPQSRTEFWDGAIWRMAPPPSLLNW